MTKFVEACTTYCEPDVPETVKLNCPADACGDVIAAALDDVVEPMTPEISGDNALISLVASYAAAAK